LLLAILLLAVPLRAWSQPPGTPAEASSRLAWEGVEAYRAQDYARALARFRAARSASPANPLLLYYLGRAAHRLGETQVAVGYYEDYLQAGPDPANVEQVRVSLAELRSTRPAPPLPPEAVAEAPPAAVTTPDRSWALVRGTAASGATLGAIVGMVVAAGVHSDAVAKGRRAGSRDSEAYYAAEDTAQLAGIAFYGLGALAAAACGYAGYVWLTLPDADAAGAAGGAGQEGAVWTWTW